ncbi:hypothetical protein [Thalassobacillus sp. CUG 92003]|uniref:hypothetical protein n=1 Tax=Thalassobacillus sp. CUG 92003 TaxID=2736641 RepID=UPI0015E6B97D|nr:hypothetical protein [Thalassobacillus sp. CUG 92003]
MVTPKSGLIIFASMNNMFSKFRSDASVVGLADRTFSTFFKGASLDQTRMLQHEYL